MKNKKRQIGQTLVEFALILPIFLLLVIGFFDVGRAVFYYSSLTNAVREATRFAIVNRDAIEKEISAGCDDGIEEHPLKLKVIESAFGINEDMLDPCTDIVVIVGKTGELFETVSIEVTLNYEPITPLLSQIVGGIPLVVQSKMYVAPITR